MEKLILELGFSVSTSTIISTAINLEPLLTALVSFGVSLVTIVGGEVIKFLVAFLKNKTKKYDEENKGDKKYDK